MIKLTEAEIAQAFKVYPTKAEAEKAFRDGKDFKHLPSGRYCSIRNFIAGANVTIYFGKNLNKSLELQ